MTTRKTATANPTPESKAPNPQPSYQETTDPHEGSAYLAPEPEYRDIRDQNRADLDSIKDFLDEVSASATEDPSAFATTAIKHFKHLLELSIMLTKALERQTHAIQTLLDTELATTSAPPPGAVPPNYDPSTYDPYRQPYNPHIPIGDTVASQSPPIPQPQQHAMAHPQPPGQPWPQFTPQQIMQMQEQLAAQNQQQQQLNQDPGYLQYLQQQQNQQPPAPTHWGPARNGQIIQPRGANGNLLDQVGAPPPATPPLFGGPPTAGGPRNNFRVDRV